MKYLRLFPTKTKHVLLFIMLGAFSCQDDQPLQTKPTSKLNETVESRIIKRCGATEVLNRKLATDPALRKRMDEIEEHSQHVIANGRVNSVSDIEIPVVVSVLYSYPNENISTAQIKSQIDVLNRDFNLQNTEAYSQIPNIFAGIVAKVGIKFRLLFIRRKAVSNSFWYINDEDMKDDETGGLRPVSPKIILNIWVVNKIVDREDPDKLIMGYGQYPGNDRATDGVVMAYRYFGTTGTVSAPYNLGRTVTHEVGHWLNLKHIWGGSGGCKSDNVADTPLQDGPHYECPSFPTASNCNGVVTTAMTMNYMDYTDDNCMFMFTQGQKDRMRALFAPGGFREEIGQP